MPAGTWNEGQLKKRAYYTGLKDSASITIRDQSLTSENYFNVIDFPTILTSGKNLVKIRSNANTLVRDSKIHVEVLDSNGNPIYTEPILYIENDGTRVISIYIYPNTPPGPTTLYIAGRSRISQDGQLLESSDNVNDLNYKNIPNILWSRSTVVSPDQFNSTEIIHIKQPTITISENIQPYFETTNLQDVAVTMQGTITASITNIPGATPAINNIVDVSGNPVTLAVQGGARQGSPGRQYGRQVQVSPSIAQTSEGNLPTEATSNPFNSILDESLLTVTEFSPLSASMVGGTIKIVNPTILVQDKTIVDVNDLAIPASQIDISNQATSEGVGFSAGNTQIQLSGSYIFGISEVMSKFQAKVYQISGFKNNNDNSIGAFKVNLISQQTIASALADAISGGTSGQGTYIVTDVSASTNATASFNKPYELQASAQSQSFAKIIVSDIEPATGDVYKIETLYKAGGQFGNFAEAGDTILERAELLEDSSAYEADASIGATFNRMGHFTDIADFNTYFVNLNTNGPSDDPADDNADQASAVEYETDFVMGGVSISSSPFNSTNDRFCGIKLKDEYMPTVFKDTDYQLSITVYATDDTPSSDPLVPKPRLDIYISGSISSILPDPDTLNAYAYPNNDLSYIENSLTTPADAGISGVVNLKNDNQYGTRIGTIETSHDERRGPLTFKFRATKNESIQPYFIIRRGAFRVADISITTFNESGFTPNFARLNVRIPSQYINVPLTFKFQYFDINNNEAQTTSLVYPVTFTGDNQIITGDNNLITGSMFIGNTLSSGIEQAGRNSAYIRSVGYEGYQNLISTSASAVAAGNPGTGPGGFLMYSGSILPETTNYFTDTDGDGVGNSPYAGVGLELVDNTDSGHLIFHTNPSILDIKVQDFFVGAGGAFICGSSTTDPPNIAIFSDNFILTTEGDVTIGADATILGDLSANKIFVPAGTDITDAVAFIDTDGVSGFSGDGAGNYQVEINTTQGLLVKDSPDGSPILSVLDRQFDGLNQGRIINGPTVTSLILPRTFYSLNELVEYPFLIDYSNLTGLAGDSIGSLQGFSMLDEDTDPQKVSDIIIPEFQFNQADEFIVIIYRAGVFSHNQGGNIGNENTENFLDQGSFLEPNQYAPAGTGTSTTPPMTAFNINFGGYSYETMYRFLNEDGVSALFGSDDFDEVNSFAQSGLMSAAALPNFKLVVNSPTNAFNAASVVFHPLNMTSGGSAFQETAKKTYNFKPRTSFGSFPIAFSDENTNPLLPNFGVTGTIANKTKPIHNPGIIVIQHGSCDFDGEFVDIKGKNMSLMIGCKRYWPTDLNDSEESSNGTMATYFMKDINVVVGNKIQVTNIIARYSNDLGGGFNPNNPENDIDVSNLTGTNNSIEDMDSAIITYYTGSNLPFGAFPQGTNGGFMVRRGGDGANSVAVNMDCLEEEEG